MPVSRHLCRQITLQALFACESRSMKFDAFLLPTLSTTWQEFYVSAESMPDFLLTLSGGVAEHEDEIRSCIVQHAPQWPLHKIHLIDRCILFIGTYELLYGRDTPPAVIINECVELAKAFGTENSGKFVNGVLNTLKDSTMSSPAKY